MSHAEANKADVNLAALPRALHYFAGPGLAVARPRCRYSDATHFERRIGLSLPSEDAKHFERSWPILPAVGSPSGRMRIVLMVLHASAVVVMERLVVSTALKEKLVVSA